MGGNSQTVVLTELQIPEGLMGQHRNRFDMRRLRWQIQRILLVCLGTQLRIHGGKQDADKCVNLKSLALVSYSLWRLV
jgi:hypothetical protein